jgi:hypothetical protein
MQVYHNIIVQDTQLCSKVQAVLPRVSWHTTKVYGKPVIIGYSCTIFRITVGVYKDQ